jgi:DNA-binding transcriptional regulator YhcF (GntR family)
MKPSYYAIIPANVRYSNLKPHAKLLYGEITALASKEGYCFASNRYFAELYGVTKNTISSWVSDLNKENFVTVKIIKKGNQVIQRRIGITQKGDTPITINQEDNNKGIINTIKDSNMELRKMKFIDELISLETNKETCKEFILYWSELNKSKTKMRYEMEKTWDTKARLDRWNSNQQKWAKPIKTSKIETTLTAHQEAKEMILKMNNQ